MSPAPSAELIRSVAAMLAELPCVRAVFLSGSHAAGGAVAASDIDFTVLVGEEADIEVVMARLAEQFEFLGHFHEVPHYASSGARLAVCTYPQPWTDHWVGNLFRSAEDLRQWQGWARHKIVDAVAIHDPRAIIGRYRTVLSGYPDRLAREVAAEALQYLRAEYVEAWGFRNPFHYAYCLRDMLEHIGIALFAINRRLYAPPLKHWHRDLLGLHPRLFHDLTELVEISAKTDLAARRSVLAHIVRKLEAASARPRPVSEPS